MAVAKAIQNLGNADAATNMGGLEAHGKAIKEVGDQIAEGTAGIAVAISKLASSVDGLASAVRASKE